MIETGVVGLSLEAFAQAMIDILATFTGIKRVITLPVSQGSYDAFQARLREHFSR